MKFRTVLSAHAIAASVWLGSGCFVAAAADTIPVAWVLGNEAEFSLLIDDSAPLEGLSCAKLSARGGNPANPGSMTQIINAAAYGGKRLRMTAAVRTQGVSGWAGIWMRVDQKDGAVVALDNMINRPIKGSSDWNLYDVVLDIPKDASVIAFGALLNGPGLMWIDDVRLEVVSQDVRAFFPFATPVKKAQVKDKWILDAPRNLEFEQTDTSAY